MAPQIDPLRERAFELFSQGRRVFEVARDLQKPRSTVQTWRDIWEDSNSQPAQVDPLEAKEMELAALRAKLKIAEGTAKIDRVPVETYNEDPFPAAETWTRWEADNAKRIERALASSKFKVTLPEDQPVGICFVSDQHIAGGNLIDMRQMRIDAEFIATTPGIYAVLGGDGIDGHIKHRSAMIAARSTPDDQLKLFDHYLQIIAEKIVVAISGNHDHWMAQFTSVDMIKWLAERNRIKYSAHNAYVEVVLGRITYRIVVAHQYRFNSTMNPTHSPKQMMNFGDHDADIGCVCHHHEHAQESFWRRGLVRWVCRPGAYQIKSDYSAQYGFPVTKPTCPTAVIFPGERKIVGFDDVRDASAYMQGLRAGRG